MRKPNLSNSMTQQETIWGWFYLIVQLFVLPTLLQFANTMLSWKLTASELRFTLYLVNFLTVLWIFRNYLGKNMDQLHQHPAYFFQAVILGLVAYSACGFALEWVMRLFFPNFSNAGESSIAALAKNGYCLTFVGTVILVPLAEECFYRGLLFRGIYDRSPVWAYIVSMTLFSLAHVLGYVTMVDFTTLVLCFFQYLPAGFALAWSYRKSGSIYASILIHMAVNQTGMLLMR